MKTELTFVLIFLTAISCNTIRHGTDNRVGLVTLQNYFAKNTVSLPDDTNYFFIKSKENFENTFDIAKTMNNTITIPDFNTQWVVAIVFKATNKNISLQFEKAEIAENNMDVYIITGIDTATLTYTLVPVAVATVPRSDKVNSIHFYVNGIDSKTLPVK